MKRIYQDRSDGLFVATSAAEAAELAGIESCDITAWTDEQMQAHFMSEEDQKKYEVGPQTWQDWANVEPIGFLLDMNERFEEVDV